MGRIRMNLTDGLRRLTYINIRLSCSTECDVDAKGEADDSHFFSTDLRVILE